MRGEKEMLGLILDIAWRDERIRAVMLNGSRANPNAKKDFFQDYDIVYFVKRLETFTENHAWTDVFGERLILQMPDEMNLPDYENNPERAGFAYLMRFKDGNRIDLTLFPLDKLETNFVLDSLSVLLLDKDNIFPELPPPNEKNYLTRKPTEKEFADVCNEFWWVSTYVAKGLRRKEMLYAKDFLENPVRKMFLKMLEWRIGIENNFSVNFGASGKYLPRYVSAAFYEKVLQTYADAKPENIWKSLFLMAEIFEESAKTVAARLEFTYNAEESENVIKYLKDVKNKGEKRPHS
jgi:aminoglycoside 6-adenylyltransferase